MKLYAYRLFILFLLAIGGRASAQHVITLSGKVIDSVGIPQKAATVFISGTTLITVSDNKGEFAFNGMPPGTFQLSVSMVGFDPYAHNVVIQNSSVKLDVVLKNKTTILREVVIGPDRRAENLAMFKLAFLGQTDNAKHCQWLNPDAVNFSFSRKTGILTADADEFLLIENKRLGYRVKYLLKDFSYNTNADIALYDGETSFEELPGTPKMKKQWAQNRLDAYNGSMMHFLRSVYRHATQQQGFAVYNVYRETSPNYANNKGTLMVDENSMDVDELLTRTDSALTSMKFRVLYIDYIGAKQPKLNTLSKSLKGKLMIEPGKKGSVLSLIAPEALIDARGSYTDYRTFYLRGYMAERRVGDQLPFEYQPPVK